MKKKYFTLGLIAFVTFCFLSVVNAQTIRRCNNNPGVSGTNVYANLQAAHDAAVAGDIIYVEPSDASYFDLTITKRLTIIGNGYYNSKNTNTSFEPRSSKLGSIIFNNGSANSVISGIQANEMYVNDVNVTVTRCTIGSVVYGESTNLVAGVKSRGNSGTVTKCIVQSISGNYSTVSVSFQFGYNCTITNNIGINTGGNAIVTTLTNSTITNNTFYINGYSRLNNLYNCVVSNNIFDARDLSGTIQFVNGVGSGNTISNNICLEIQATPSGNGNVNFGSAAATFLVNNPWTTWATEDTKFQLAAGSPAIGIGTGGINAGAFGGPNPYVLSGVPAYPVITNFTTSGVGNTSTPLQVNVTVRGNN